MVSLVPWPFQGIGYLWSMSLLVGVGYPSGDRVSGGRVSRGKVSGGVGYLGDIQRVWVSRGNRVSPKTTKAGGTHPTGMIYCVNKQ